MEVGERGAGGHPQGGKAMATGHNADLGEGIRETKRINNGHQFESELSRGIFQPG